MRPLDRVDDLLHPGAVVEVALVAVAPRLNLRDKVSDEVGVEQRPPRLARAAAGRIEALRNFQLLELDAIPRGDLDRLRDAEFFDRRQIIAPWLPYRRASMPG